MSYEETYERSRQDPSGFWLEAAQNLHWDKSPQIGLADDKRSWFPDGRLNLCHNAVDRHVAAGRGDEPALLFESPVTETSREYSFADLQDEVSRTAGMIQAQGVKTGDRAIIYMPMIPEAVFAMLACARLGVVHSVVFGGFSAAELAKRINDCAPVIILTASCGIEGNRVIPYMPIIDEALTMAGSPCDRVLVWQRPLHEAELDAARHKDWQQELAGSAPAPCVSVTSNHPLYILYTSGTTGKPKGVVRDTAGYGVALTWSMRNIYGVEPGETYWAASDIGWVVGHSYSVYGPLLHGCATLIFEGKPIGTPDAGTFWRLINKHNVSILFTAPTAIRAIRSADPDGEFVAANPPASLRALFLAGERADPDTVEWIGEQLQRPVIDHWWQTELGWPALASCLGLGGEPAAIGAAGHAVPGFAFDVLDEQGQSVEAEVTGNLVIARPLPPGAMSSLWQNETGYHGYFSAFDGYYATGDAGVKGSDGAYRIMGRTDDIINTAGHRLSTGGIEEVVASCTSVVECAVIGGTDALKGEVPVVFFVRAKGDGAELDATCQITGAIRERISPIASPRNVIEVHALPKTRSGKILRNLLRAIINGDEIVIPQTIENPDIVQDVMAVAAEHVAAKG